MKFSAKSFLLSKLENISIENKAKEKFSNYGMESTNPENVNLQWSAVMRLLRKMGMAAIVLIGLCSQALATPLVGVTWLAEHLNAADLVVIDLRNKIDGGSRETFLAGHIPNSRHSDYLKDGWRVQSDGVVGLLPTAKQFEDLARGLGVRGDSHVVLVPAGKGATDFGSAARAYWTFKVFGHDKVSILDGGYAAWATTYADRIETGEVAPYAPGDFVAAYRPELYAGETDIHERIAAGEGAVLLDARPKDQFIGASKHPKATRLGRIPGSVSQPQDLAYLDAQERLKSVTELTQLYAGVQDGPVISYCNTGHWAATNWFVLSELLGRKDVRVYDGSMVEWTANPDNPVEVGESNLEKLKGFIRNVVG